MASALIRMVQKLRLEELTIGDGSNIAYVFKLEAENKAKTLWLILSADAPGSNFDDVDNDSLYIDTTNHVLYIKTADDTWTVVGDQSAS